MLASVEGPGEALFAITCMGIAAAVLFSIIRSRERKERLRVMEKALHSNQLDDETRRSIAHSLSGEARRDRPLWLVSLYQGVVYLCRHAVFVCGWIGMFVGAGLMIIGDGEMFAGGVMTALTSFGVVTVPMALREMEVRRRA